MNATIRTTFALMLLAGLAAGCSNPADGKPEAQVSDAKPETGSSTQEGGAYYAIADGSTITWVGSKVTGSHDGGFNNFSGAVMLGPDGQPESSSVEVLIDATSIWSDNDRLTGHLKSADFFEVETYPTAEFSSTSIEKTADGYSITGNLTMHGVTKSITFPAQISVTDSEVTAQAEFSIKRFDWGIEYKGKADDLIRDEVVIRFDLRATPADADADAGAEESGAEAA